MGCSHGYRSPGIFGGKKPNLVFVKGGGCWKAGPLVIDRWFEGPQDEGNGVESVDWPRERAQCASTPGHCTPARGR